MATVVTHAVCSLDGFIARPDDSVGPLFDWYENGDTELRGGGGAWVFHVSETSAAYCQPWWDVCRAVVMGRRLFDITNGWNGVPSVGEHVFVVTHEPPADWVPSETLTAEDAPFTFVSDVADAIRQARELAGDGGVAVCAGDVGGQAVAAGLVDEIAVDIAPVLLGQGKRYFGEALVPEGLLEDPDVVIQGDRVLHLRYRVRR